MKKSVPEGGRMESFESNFMNEYGERWFFEFNYETNRAFVTGDDVGDEIYPVIEVEHLI